ncbi:excinuclease ABC subunit UvrA [Tropheryma whipplei]|uniref:excinuclease ABC subunit UvrA n=1 Tax=Tropheryma whipplei TaxID=2039 RepID=UPI0004BAEAF0|nr:excinuclease ABC subunit UvrA [Tropheryma whipplei]
MSSRRSFLRVKNARVHNLKNLNVRIPRNSMTVFTGLSGSGKSSLAFDTIFAEGQRRYIESLSAYARQFLERLDRPEVDSIDGLSPSVAIDQKTTSRNPRSTVGTVTEIFDYLRLLWARVGVLHCPECDLPVQKQTIQQIVDSIAKIPHGERFMLLSPLVRQKKGEFVDLFSRLTTSGFSRVVVDEEIYLLTEVPKLKKNSRHTIKVVVDRLVSEDNMLTRLTDSIETAFGLSNICEVQTFKGDVFRFSINSACPNLHFLNFDKIEPRTFSFNSPVGACPDCDGIGTVRSVNMTTLVPDIQLSVEKIALDLIGKKIVSKNFMREISALARNLKFTLNTPWSDLTDYVQNTILHAKNFLLHNTRVRYYTGLVRKIERDVSENSGGSLSGYLYNSPCRSCSGKRLRASSLCVKVSNKNIIDVCDMPLDGILHFFKALDIPRKFEKISSPILREIISRLEFLIELGLGYLTLSRSITTISGGESQRIRLATQIGSGLTEVLYVLDEPSIGLHKRDNEKLIKLLLNLRNRGNTLIVVEHDEETIRSSDWIVDIGPGAGRMGGQVVYSGPVGKMPSRSLTGKYLSGELMVSTPKKRRVSSCGITLSGAKENNLKNITVFFPLKTFIVITGVSGSGKSTLVNSVLCKALSNICKGNTPSENNCQDADCTDACTVRNGMQHNEQTVRLAPALDGAENISKVVHIDQKPIGRTPRSNLATYTGVFDKIRDIFSKTPTARARGYSPGRFSFNLKGGRCKKCKGDGCIKVEMNFLPDVYVDCEDCNGMRYNRDTLQVLYNNMSIHDVLTMPVCEAVEFFRAIPSIHQPLKLMDEIGLGYMTLGQPAPTLSGGEAQRIKLAAQLQKRTAQDVLYVLDEPTTGLHFHDVRQLLEILHRLVDNGNTVIVIEHNLDVIKTADHVIDMGPEGGNAGGSVVACGTPEEVALHPDSATGYFLKKCL